MAYQGIYKVKNTSKYEGDSTNVVYRSMWEKWVFKWCDENPNVLKWSSEEVVIPYYYEVDKRYHRYFMDLKIKLKNGKILLIEIKPEKETKVPKKNGRGVTKRFVEESFTYVKNQNKWKAAEEYAKDNGWLFEVWTEKHLQKLGIMPKPLKKLKPLKPYRRKKKTK